MINLKNISPKHKVILTKLGTLYTFIFILSLIVHRLSTYTNSKGEVVPRYSWLSSIFNSLIWAFIIIVLLVMVSRVKIFLQ